MLISGTLCCGDSSGCCGDCGGDAGGGGGDAGGTWWFIR